MKLLYTLLFALFLSCSTEDIIEAATEEIDSGTRTGGNIDECIDIELFCVDKEGEFEYTTPESEFFCVCNW